jgi:endogenous inhibitor of DNA gyrase (YacG/DUF329 family)
MSAPEPSCRCCGAPLVVKAGRGGARRFCGDQCAQHHRRGPHPSAIELSCAQCGGPFTAPGSSPRWRFCSQRCAWRAANQARPGRIAAAARAAVQRATTAARIFGSSCPLAYRTCDVDRALFVARSTSPAKRCSADCRREWARREQRRLYQRPDDPRRYRYWRVADSPEAVALARKHRELRDQVKQLQAPG